MRVELQPAFVIHTRAYRNTSLIADVFTRDQGMVSLIAKGVNRPKNPRRALLQPFIELRVSYSGRTDLSTLINIEPAASAVVLLSGSLFFSGFYINELLQRLLHRHDPYESLFFTYKDALQRLAESPDRVEPLLRRFEYQLLSELGYGLQLECVADTGRPPIANERYYYDMERGPITVSAEGSRGNAPALRGSTLLALAGGQFDDPRYLPEIKQLMRWALKHYLGERPLKSRELFGKTIKRDQPVRVENEH